MSAISPDTIIGTIGVTVTLSCQRLEDKQRGRQPKIYTFVMSAQHSGSASLSNSMPAEMEVLTTQAVTTVRKWEWRAKKASQAAAQIHRRPGT